MLLWLAATALLLAGIASPTLAVRDPIHWGAGSVCLPTGYNGAEECNTVDVHCGFRVMNAVPYPLESAAQALLLYGGQCAHYQAVRSFAIMGVIMAGAVVAVTLFMFLKRRMDRSAWQAAAHVVMAVESAFVMIALSLAVAYLHNLESAGVDRGAAFGLLVAAWPIGLLAWALWAASGYVEKDWMRSDLAGPVPQLQQPSQFALAPGEAHVPPEARAKVYD